MARLPLNAEIPCRCGATTYREPSVTGRRRALRCADCHSLVANCQCQRVRILKEIKDEGPWQGPTTEEWLDRFPKVER